MQVAFGPTVSRHRGCKGWHIACPLTWFEAMEAFRGTCWSCLAENAKKKSRNAQMSKQTVEKPLWWNGRWCRFFLFQVFNVQCLFKRIFWIAGQCQKPYKNLQSICGTKTGFLISLLLYLLARCDFITQAMLRVLLLFVAAHGEFLSPLQRAIRQGDASSVKHLLAENEENDQGYSYDDELGFLTWRSIFGGSETCC